MDGWIKQMNEMMKVVNELNSFILNKTFNRIADKQTNCRQTRTSTKQRRSTNAKKPSRTNGEAINRRCRREVMMTMTSRKRWRAHVSFWSDEESEKLMLGAPPSKLCPSTARYHTPPTLRHHYHHLPGADDDEDDDAEDDDDDDE